jgi:HK97 family phage major capsid protein
MGKLIQYREEMTKLLTDLKELQGKEERSDEEESSIDQKLARVNDLGPMIIREKNLEEASSQLDEYTKPAPNGRVTTRQDAQAQHHKPERTDLGYRFAHSDELKEAPRSGGNSRRMQVGSFYERNHDGVDDMEQRTLIYTGATSGLVMQDRLGGVYRPLLQPFQVRMRDVLINGRTESNAVQYVRELAYTNAAAETAEAVSTATGAKPESALTFVVTTDNVATIAHWVPITRQVMDDQAQMETYVNGRLIEGLKLVEDVEILTGPGTGATLTGLMTRSGIGNLDAAYWTANPLPTVAAAANKADRIRRAKKYVAVTGLANASFVVLHPDDYEQMDELKTTTGEYLFSNPTAYAEIPRLWGMTVVQSTSIATNNFFMGDGTMAAIFDRMDATILVGDQHSDFLIRNMIAILAEERLALACFRPAAFAKGVLS